MHSLLGFQNESHNQSNVMSSKVTAHVIVINDNISFPFPTLRNAGRTTDTNRLRKQFNALRKSLTQLAKYCNSKILFPTLL